MRSSKKATALLFGLTAALVMAACSSDPTNPETSGNAATGSSVAASTGDSSAAVSSADASGATGSSGAASSGATSESGAATPPAGGGGPTGEPAEPGQAAAGATGSVNLFLYQKPNGNFNPLAGASGPDAQVYAQVYEALYVTSPETRVAVPLLATELPTVSADGLTYTYHLRDDVLWSDGQPLTSEDVVTTWTIGANSKMLNGPAKVFEPVKGVAEYNAGTADTISGIKAVDDHTVELTLLKPGLGAAMIVAYLGILPAHIVKDLKIETFATDPYFQKPTVGSGPYKFVSYQTDQQIQLTANENFRFKIGVKDVFLKIGTSDVATSQLQTGELDVTNIAPVDMETVQGFPGVKVTAVEAPGFVRAAWNQSKPQFKDPKVLQAFLYAVDRKALVEGALQGQGTVRNSVFPPAWQAPDLNDYAYDPEKAKQLLAEANWDSNLPVKISWIQGGNPDRDTAATIMENQLNAVGIKAELDPVQASWVADNVPTAKFDVFIYGGGDPFPYSVIPITSCQEPGKGPNNGLFCDEEYQKIVEEAGTTADPEKSKQLYQEASKLENVHPSQMWLYSPKIVWAVSDKLQNFVPPIDLGGSPWAAWNWQKAG